MITPKCLMALGLAGVLSVAAVSSANAADRPKAATVPRPVLAPAVMRPAPLLHPILWCAGGVVVSVVVHNPIPAAIGCTVTVVKVHHHLHY